MHTLLFFSAYKYSTCINACLLDSVSLLNGTPTAVAELLGRCVLLTNFCDSIIYLRISLFFNLCPYFFSMVQIDINSKKKIPLNPSVVSTFAKRLPSKQLFYYRCYSCYNDRDGLFAKILLRYFVIRQNSPLYNR